MALAVADAGKEGTVMTGVWPTASNRCPSCRAMLSEAERRVGVCNDCGAVFPCDEAPPRREDAARKDAADRRAVLMQLFTGATGLALMATGLVFIACSSAGPEAIFSRPCMGIAAITVISIGYRWVMGESVRHLLLVFGLVWLVMGIFLWKHL